MLNCDEVAAGYDWPTPILNLIKELIENLLINYKTLIWSKYKITHLLLRATMLFVSGNSLWFHQYVRGYYSSNISTIRELRTVNYSIILTLTALSQNIRLYSNDGYL